MHEFLMALLRLNAAVALSVLVVLVLRRPVRKQFGAQTAYGLWLLIPAAALATLFPARSIQLVMSPPAPLHYVPSMDLSWLLLLDWAIGAFVVMRHLANAQQEFDDAVFDGKAGPAVTGFLKPRIVTPSDFASRYAPEEQDAILAHEKVHLWRQDARFNGLAALLRCICWFNPLVHIGARLMRVDQEMACDALALARHPSARRVYARTLLKTQMIDQALPVGCYWPGGGDHPLTERIEMLTVKRPTAPRRLIGASIVVVAATLSGWGAWAAQPARIELIAAPSKPAQKSDDLAQAANDKRTQMTSIAASLQAFETDLMEQQKQAALKAQPRP